jgi:chitin deacetylase
MPASAEKLIFLTFDDGPNEPYTSLILDILKKYQARASFFVCGKNVLHWPKTAKRIVAEGHLIGNHTYSHSALRAIIGCWSKEIEKTNQIIEKTTGVRPTHFRPPWGRAPLWLRKKLQRQRLTLVLWNIDSKDWRLKKAERIAAEVIKKARSSAVILMHDGKNTKVGEDRSLTIKALPLVLDNLKKQGFRFEAIDY